MVDCNLLTVILWVIVIIICICVLWCVCEIIKMSLSARKSTLYLQRLQMYDLYSRQEHFKARLLFTIITGYCHCITIITLHMIAHHYSSVIQICDAKCDSEKYGYGTDWCVIIHTTVLERKLSILMFPILWSYYKLQQKAHMAKRYEEHNKNWFV